MSLQSNKTERQSKSKYIILPNVKLVKLLIFSYIEYLYIFGRKNWEFAVKYRTDLCHVLN